MTLYVWICVNKIFLTTKGKGWGYEIKPAKKKTQERWKIGLNRDTHIRLITFDVIEAKKMYPLYIYQIFNIEERIEVDNKNQQKGEPKIKQERRILWFLLFYVNLFLLCSVYWISGQIIVKCLIQSCLTKIEI